MVRWDSKLVYIAKRAAAILYLSIVTLAYFAIFRPRFYFFKEHISPPGIIVKATGGLGNQLFKYAISLAAAKKFNIPLYIYNYDGSAQYKNGRSNSLTNPSKRKFMLDLFYTPMGNFTQNSWSDEDVENITCEEFLYNTIPQKHIETKLLMSSDHCHSEKYFENVKQEIKYSLRPVLDTKSKAFTYWTDFIDHVNSKEDRISVAIHIRRGDYVIRKYWSTPLSYFRNAMRLMKQKFDHQKIAFFVFSDDMKYVKQNLLEPEKGEEDLKILNDEIHFVSGTHGISSLEEFVLMSKCKNMIISNSTFSWWAAYLTMFKDSVVIAPKFHPKFFDHVKDESLRQFKIYMWNFKYPLDWIQIDPYNGLGL